jgi:hypothetical protein
VKDGDGDGKGGDGKGGGEGNLSVCTYDRSEDRVYGLFSARRHIVLHERDGLDGLSAAVLAMDRIVLRP